MFRFAPTFHAAFPVFNGWIDLFALSDTLLEGTSGPNPDNGWDIKLQITNYIDPVVDPDFGKHGIGMRWTFTFPGEPDWSYWLMFDKDAAEWAAGIPYDIFQVFVDPIAIFDDDLDPVLNPSFVTVPSQNIAFLAMSECWVFPELPAPTGFAEFNGVDSRIIFDDFTNAHGQRFRLECDLRLFNTDLGIILGRTNNTTRWVGIRPHNIQWRSGVVNFSPDIPINEWGTFRVDHNWVDGPASGWKCYWNDVLIGTAGAGVSELPFNSMGFRANSFGTNFDMRLLQLEDTDPAAPRILISTELQVNACDIGEQTLKGTTENMVLASCP